jgi:hypothetical protein
MLWGSTLHPLVARLPGERHRGHECCCWVEGPGEQQLPTEASRGLGYRWCWYIGC